MANITSFRRVMRPVISLSDAKRNILGITPEVMASPESYVTSVINQVLLSKQGMRRVDLAQVRLQTLCAVGNLAALKDFFNIFTQNNGIIATELLVNGYIRAGNGIPNCTFFYMTPLLCALFWGNDREIIRLLYSYGAHIHEPDITNVFAEEKLLMVPYFDHICGHGFGLYPVPMWRQSGDFLAAIQELRYLTGEDIPTEGWNPPPLQVV